MSLGSAPGLGFEPADGSTPGLGFTPGVPMEGTFSEATSTSDRLTVIINKPEGQTLGLDLVPSGESVVINEIKPDGAVIEHNAENPAKKVEAFDILKSINGSGPTMDDIIAAVKNAGGSLKLELERRPAAVALPADTADKTDTADTAVRAGQFLKCSQNVA